MEIIRTSGVESYAVVPLIDAADNKSYKASPTLAAGDVKVIRHTGGAWNYSNIGTLPAIIGGSATKQILVTLTATELTSDNLDYPIIVQFVDQTATKEWVDQEIIIWTKPQVANLTQIDGLATSGNNATLNLKQLNIVNNSGIALNAESTGGNGNGIAITGHGTGAGLLIFSGAGAVAQGVHIVCNATDGNGINITGHGAGSGIASTGGATGHGAQLNGGATSGHGLQTKAGAAGAGHGIYAVGIGASGSGIAAEGAGAGHGISATGGSSSGSGINAVGTGTGHGVQATGGATGGAGARFVGTGASGHGVSMVAGSTTANGLKIAGGSTNGAAIDIRSISGDGVSIVSAAIGSGLTISSQGTGLLVAGAVTGFSASGGSDAGARITGGAGQNGLVLAKGSGGAYDLQAAEVQAIKVKTDQMVFTVANRLDATAQSTVTIADGSITAAKFAAGAVDANAFDQTAADKVWATTSRTITDKAGYALTSAYDPAKTAAQASALATTDGKVDLVKAKTDQLIFTGGAVDSNVASIETDALSAAAVSAAAVTKIQDGLALVADVEAVGVAVGAVDSHLSAVGANVQSVVDVLPSGGAEISKFALTDELDTVAVSEIFELVLCMVTGRFKKDYPTAGDLTFYKQDNLTVLKLMHVTETERTRI